LNRALSAPIAKCRKRTARAVIGRWIFSSAFVRSNELSRLDILARRNPAIPCICGNVNATAQII
jgi:hypothetical protein